MDVDFFLVPLLLRIMFAVTMHENFLHHFGRPRESGRVLSLNTHCGKTVKAGKLGQMGFVKFYPRPDASSPLIIIAPLVL